MVERVHGANINKPVLDALGALGFKLYRLIPGLGILAPFEERAADRFQLNLFAARPDRARHLEQAGLLVSGRLTDFVTDETAWSRCFADKAFFRPFVTTAARPAADANEARYRTALNQYAMSTEADRPAIERWSALCQSLITFLDLIGKNGRVTRMLTLVRTAAAAGERQLAVQALNKMPLGAHVYEIGMVSEPFVPAAPRFDDIDPDGEFPTWCALQIFERLEGLRAFSSMYASADSMPFFEQFRPSRFFSPELERRRQLVRMLKGKQKAPEHAPLLARRSAGHLNVEFWSRT
jgi:hypothetical protein